MGKKIYEAGDRVRLLDVPKDDPPQLGTVIEKLNGDVYVVKWDNGNEQGYLEYYATLGRRTIHRTRNNRVLSFRITPYKEEE